MVIASYLGTHLLILGRGWYGIYVGLQYFFKNFLITCKERFWRAEIFFENFILPFPLESQLDSPINAVLLCTIAVQQTDVTHTQQTPIRTNALRMQMRLNQNVRGDAKSAPVAMACLELILMFFHYKCDSKMDKER